jgi:hypothetical protein
MSQYPPEGATSVIASKPGIQPGTYLRCVEATRRSRCLADDRKGAHGAGLIRVAADRSRPTCQCPGHCVQPGRSPALGESVPSILPSGPAPK